MRSAIAVSSSLRSPRRRDVLIAGAVAVVAQAETWATAEYEPKAAFAAAALAMCLALAWRRIAPIVVLIAVFMPLLAMATAGERLDSTYIMLVLLIAFGTVGLACERRRAVAGLAIGLSLLLVLLLIERASVSAGGEAPPIGDLVFLGGIFGIVWGLAVGLRERSLRAGELEQRADRLEREREERARAAVAAERARIARELHDVVAHSVSVIAVQTGSMRRRLRHERPRETAELAAIEQTARQALAEMRRMLGLLRTDDEGPVLAPQPGIGQIDQLVEHARATGLSVELDLEGDPRPLPPGVDLAAYRIVQEALTNVLKHAGPARAQVAVRFRERELELEVSDDGRGAVGAHDDGGGHGLVGMRERVALYGGSLAAGPGGDGGFTVTAQLPIGAS